jgi:ribosome maturation factor RimP
MKVRPKSDVASRVIEEVTRLTEPILDEMGFEMVDVEYLSERGRWVLRIYADKEGGLTLNDCASISREIGDLIDVKDIVAHEYVLEVSSPGLNRALKKETDFSWALGKKIKVRMAYPIEGRRNFTGRLRRFQGGILDLDVQSDRVSLPLGDVEKANVVHEFD